MNEKKSKVLVVLVIISMLISALSLTGNVVLLTKLDNANDTVDDIYSCINANGRDIENIYDHQLWIYDSLGYDWQNDRYEEDGQF